MYLKKVTCFTDAVNSKKRENKIILTCASGNNLGLLSQQLQEAPSLFVAWSVQEFHPRNFQQSADISCTRTLSPAPFPFIVTPFLNNII